MPKARRRSATGEENARAADAKGDAAALDIPTAAEAEAEALADVNRVLTRFKESARRENERFADATDSEHWIALSFQTRGQKEEFLQKIGWLDLGGKYLDGMACAEAQGITLTSRVPPVRRHRIDRRYVELAQPELDFIHLVDGTGRAE